MIWTSRMLYIFCSDGLVWLSQDTFPFQDGERSEQMLGDSDSQAILEKRPIKDLLGLNGFYEYLEVNWGILLSFFFFFCLGGNFGEFFGTKEYACKA